MAQNLVLQNIEKRYGTRRAVFTNVNLVFGAGTATGLAGPNGSGKTTLLRLLSTAAFPTAGSITYDGAVIHDAPHRYLRHVGVVGESSEMPRYLNAVELLTWILRSREAWSDASPERIDALLSRLELDERRMELIGTYSSGMVKKTQIAAALISGPSVLLADEPFRGLDRSASEALLDLLAEHRNAGGTLVVASHVDGTLEPICDRIIEFPLDPTT